MPVYAYKGITRTGKKVKGIIDADSIRGLKQLLQKEGIYITEVLEEAKLDELSKKELNIKRLFRRVTALDIALITRQLATLTKAGIPLVEALNAIIDQTDNPELKTVITKVKERVNEGSSLADALSNHPKYFSELYVNMVNAGEQSGTLEGVLERLAYFTETEVALKNKLIASMAYPIFMAIIGSIIIWIMLVVVVPKVTRIFETFGKDLPWYTKLLIATSNFLISYWWLILLLGIGTIVGFKYWKRTPKGRELWDNFKLKLPIIGPLIRKLAISRFSKTLATLLSSGVPIMKAMEITKKVLVNVVLEKVVEEARMSVREGESIAEPLKRSGKFDPIVVRMIAIGEKSGQLEEMLENVANAYEAQVSAKLNTLTSLLEPLMIVIMGGVVGAITFSILSPLLQMNQFIQ